MCSQLVVEFRFHLLRAQPCAIYYRPVYTKTFRNASILCRHWPRWYSKIVSRLYVRLIEVLNTWQYLLTHWLKILGDDGLILLVLFSEWADGFWIGGRRCRYDKCLPMIRVRKRYDAGHVIFVLPQCCRKRKVRRKPNGVRCNGICCLWKRQISFDLSIGGCWVILLLLLYFREFINNVIVNTRRFHKHILATYKINWAPTITAENNKKSLLLLQELCI